MLWVERDLAGIVAAVFDRWDSHREELTYRHLYAMDARHTPEDVCATIEKVTGLPTRYVVLPTTGNASRDVMFDLYNRIGGTYPGFVPPDPFVLDTLGVELHGLEQFVRERLVPHLGLASDS